MILIDNITFLKKRFPLVWEKVKKVEDTPEVKRYEVEVARNQSPTLYMKSEGKGLLYYHSKYNPQNEAEKFMDQFNLSDYKHVFFYGVGLGYYVEEMLKRCNDLEYSLYEPSPSIFYHFMNKRNLSECFTRLPNNFFIEENEKSLLKNLADFLMNNKKEILIIVHPVYEKTFLEQYQKFITTFQEIVQDRRNYIHTNLAFEKRWIINSLMNIPTTLETTNFILDKKSFFQNKPVVLVSAGPSLYEEIDNIRYIKNNGLAYIITVGSALNALIAYDIYPDLTCSYDPKEHNVLVFEQIVAKKINSIPLVYGSTIGFESLQMYPGPKLHTLTDKDTLAYYILKNKDNREIDIVHDSTSVAVVALQILKNIDSSLVILVGQNLAYKDKRLYAEGIEYSYRSSFWTDEEEKKAILVEDVLGNQIYSSDSFNRMREQLEMHIEAASNLEVINTTNGGAKIKGTRYLPLSEVINTSLQTRVVDDNWLAKENEMYDTKYALQQGKKIRHAALLLEELFIEIKGIVVKMSHSISTYSTVNLPALFNKFDHLFNTMQKNICFKLLISQMNKVRFELIVMMLGEARYEQDPLRKAKKVSSEFSVFIDCCLEDISLVKEVLESMILKIEKIAVKNIS